MTLQELLGQALREHQSGQFDRAERSYRTVLGKNPKHPDALNLLGMLLAETGRADEGAEFMRKAIAVAPQFAPFHLNLGETYRRQAKYELAVGCFKRTIELDGRIVEAHNNLAAALAGMGRWEEAIGAAQRALAIRPGFAGAEFNLANAFEGLGRHEEAIAAYRKALAIQPGYVDALINLGTAYQRALRIDEAIAAFVEATRVKPDSAEAFNNLAVVLEARGKGSEAMAAYGMAVKLNPNNTHAKSNYGYALAKIGRLDEALEICKSAAASADADADAFVHLGFVYKEAGNLQEAMKCCLRAIELDPKLAAAHNAVGNILKDMGEIKQAIADFRRAVELNPDEGGYHSNLLYTLNFDAECSPGELLAEHRAWATRHCAPYRPLILPHGNDRNPDRRLRIGYVSPDFRMHPVGRFMLPLLAEHDRRKFEIYCYATVKSPDALTERMRGYADVWRDLRGVSNIETAAMVHADKIDILVDLTMHMADNRLTVFAYKPAPVQVTYLAYAGTTGMDTIDYRITDPWLDPPGSSEGFYTETSVRPGASYWCYEAPFEGLAQTPLPLLGNGAVTFGCLNNFCKISRGALETWCRILASTPGSRLMVHAQLGAHRERMREMVVGFGIDPGRVIFVESLPLAKYLEQYGRIDIGLDPFPYVGGTTTCDAMWMGVPVVTLSGKTAVARGGVSIMNNVGVPELIAPSTEEYVRIAVELANDRGRLEHLRATLRERMKGSALMDAKGFARGMEGVYREMWRKWSAVGGDEAGIAEAMQHLQANQPDKAEPILRKILQKRPGDAEVMRLLGTALSMMERVDEGVALLRKSVELEPGSAVAHVNLGWALLKKGSFDQAIAEYREAVRLRPDSADARYNLGFALAARRRLEEAADSLREAIRLQPQHARASVDLCTTLRELGRQEEALAVARDAVRLNPNLAEAQNSLGMILGETLHVEEAVASLREAVRLKPDWAIARFNLGRALMDVGELDETIACYRRAMELKPDMIEAYDGLAFVTHYHPDFDSRWILEECRRWSRQFELPLKGQLRAHLNDRSANRRLRVGYVSPDFREHPAGRFMLPLLEGHDHEKFEIYAYSSGNRADSLTERLRRSCDGWREIRELSDDDAAELVRKDGIDILVDLSMHMTDNRLPVFARKPAPVQATWLAYPGTTGLEAIDYRLTDPYLDPAGVEEFYSEKSIRLRDTYWCYDPLIDEIDSGPPPMTRNGYVTFGNLNNFCKVSGPTLELWARVLDRVKESRLLMLSPQGGHRQRILEFFQGRGIDRGRIELVDFQPRQKYFETYRRIDIGLDTLPYNGHTTSMDSMWMGVPVVTRIGRTVVGRGGLSQLSNLGLEELASETDEGFVQIAEELARDRTRLEELRTTLRARMKASPLMDGKRFARSMEEAFGQMWRVWCESDVESAEESNRLGETLRMNQPYECEIGDAAGGVAHLDAAIAAFRRAIRLNPGFAEAHCNLGRALKDAGRIDEALESYRRAIELKPDFPDAYDCLAYGAYFHPEYDSARILEESKRWSQRFEHEAAAGAAARVTNRSVHRRLRIGYVGNGFCQHCQSLFTLPLLSNHDRVGFEIFCYADVERADAVTERIRACVDHWRPIHGASDEAVTKQIAEDRIDLLVDLTMHMPGSRLGVFARRPAPVQATWLAYPGTTGLKGIDYRLTDPFLDPPGVDHFYSEESIRLRDTFWCYDPLCEEIESGPLPMAANGYVTFGNLNNFCKVSRPSLDLWGSVLEQVEGSRLLLLSPRGAHRQEIREFFRGRRIDPARIEFVDFQPRRKYFEIYRKIDIGLDTLPYNGHTTSLDSMWMGVPVVTRIGRTVVGRAGWSQLNNVGLAELASETDEEFVRVAAGLAKDRARLTDLRRTLRGRMKVSPLMDGKRFAIAMEGAYREIWRRWCESADTSVNIPGNDAQAHSALASVLCHQREFGKAIAASREAIRLDANCADAYTSLGFALGEMRDFVGAIAAYQAGLHIRPDHAQTLSNLCSALRERGRLDEAVAAGRDAVRVDGKSASAHNNLGIALGEKGDFDGAIAAFRQAIALQPDLAMARYNLARALKETGELDEALAEYRRAIDLKPDLIQAYDSVAYVGCFKSDYDPKQNLEDCRRWSRQFEAPLRGSIRPHPNERSADRRLRVGYVSADFYRHPVGRFIAPLLGAHDRERFEIFAYSSGSRADEVTARLRASCDGWREIGGVSDEAAAELVRTDRIDILVDLSMHMADNRLLVFARKPAPVQATYLAYVGTTGVEAIDYRITDPWLDPPGSAQDVYSERSIWLARSYWCYEPMTEGLETSALPATMRGSITFGCLNSFTKLTRGAVETWARLMAQTPGSRLILHARAGKHRERVRDIFESRDVGRERIEFVDLLPAEEYLAQYQRIDIALDPFPYVGGTTTCDAMWMGVPVVTLSGKTAISRGGVSIMNNVGLPELIGQSIDDYVRIAVELAKDRARLEELRRTLRERMTGSALMDATGFARDIEGAYRKMWKEFVSFNRE